MKRFRRYRFWADKSGSIMPIFVMLLGVLIPAIGSAVDYSRILRIEQKLQFATDAGVAAAVAEGRYGKKLKYIADNFIAANLPKDTKFETRRRIVDGKLVLQARSLVELPVMALAGYGEKYVYANAPIPTPAQQTNHLSKPRYTKGQLRDLRRMLDRKIDKMPPRDRAKLRRKFDNYLR